MPTRGFIDASTARTGSEAVRQVLLVSAIDAPCLLRAMAEFDNAGLKRELAGNTAGPERR